MVIMNHDVDSLIHPNTYGVIVIHDASGFTFRHLMNMVSNSQIGLIFSQYGQEASCLDLKQIHYINCSSIIAKLYNFFKPFLSKELKEKNFFHSSIESLYEFIGKEYLPIEYGGTEGTLNEYQEILLSKLHEYRDFVIKDENFFLLNE